MSVGYNPKIVTDGLTFHLDLDNPNCYLGEPTTNEVQYPVETVVSWGGANGWWQHTNGTNYRYMYTQLPNGITGYAWGADNLGSGLYGYGPTYGCRSADWSLGVTYTVSIWARAISGAASSLYVRTADTGGSLNYYNFGSPTIQWKRVSVSFTAIAGDVTGNMLTWSGINVMIWGCQIERKSHVTRNVFGNVAVNIAEDLFNGIPAQISPNTLTRPVTGSLMNLAMDKAVVSDVTNAPFNSSGEIGTFTGTQFIRGPEISILNSPLITVECWVKLSALSNNGFFFEKGQVNTQYSLFQGGSFIYFRLGTVFDLTFATSVIGTNWAHIAGTFAPYDMKLYANGVQQATNGPAGPIATNTNGWSIGVYGGYNGARGYYHNGEIGIVRIYNRNLTSDEVKQNFNAQRSRFGL